jgi:hypothetical protein
MIRTRNYALNNITPVEITIEDEINVKSTLIISNTSANKHMVIGNSDVSSTNYGIRLEHDAMPLSIDLNKDDRLWAIGEDATVTCSVMVIEK